MRPREPTIQLLWFGWVMTDSRSSASRKTLRPSPVWWYPGEFTEAVAMAATAGDPLGLPQDTPGAHGINDDRITAFMCGYLSGVDTSDLQRLERQAKLVPAKPEYPRGTPHRTRQMAVGVDKRRGGGTITSVAATS